MSQDDPIAAYRAHLVLAEQKAQEDFDKTVLALSGGALGISFAFLKDIVGSGPLQHPRWLFAAWLAWGLSVACVLASYFTSQLALRKAIGQVDKQEIRKARAGGAFDWITALLNALGGALFLAGVVLILVFVGHNLEV